MALEKKMLVGCLRCMLVARTRQGQPCAPHHTMHAQSKLLHATCACMRNISCLSSTTLNDNVYHSWYTINACCQMSGPYLLNSAFEQTLRHHCHHALASSSTSPGSTHGTSACHKTSLGTASTIVQIHHPDSPYMPEVCMRVQVISDSYLSLTCVVCIRPLVLSC